MRLTRCLLRYRGWLKTIGCLLSLLCFLAQMTSGWVAFLLVRKTAMSFDKAVGRPSNKYVPRKKQAAVKVPWYAAMIKASKVSWEVDHKAKIFMPRVRLELTAFRLWDWRAAYCATEAGWKLNGHFCIFWSRKLIMLQLILNIWELLVSHNIAGIYNNLLQCQTQSMRFLAL